MPVVSIILCVCSYNGVYDTCVFVQISCKTTYLYMTYESEI